MTTITDLYDRARSTPSDFWEHVEFISDLTVYREAKVVIELGTRSGVSTAGWLHGLAQTDGQLWSVDIDPRPDLPDIRSWRFVQGDDLSTDVYNSLPEQADIVFIDTSHDYTHTLNELNLYRWKLWAGGCIVLHDTELARPLGVNPGPLFPVRAAITKFCDEHRLAWSNRPQNNGLGIIEVGPVDP